MKFAYGAWQSVSGVSTTTIQRCYEWKSTQGELKLIGLDRMGHGGDRFEGTAVSVTVSSPMADVIRVRVQHHQGPASGPKGFDLDYDLRSAGDIADSLDEITFQSGALSLCVSKSNWSMKLMADRETVAKLGNLGIASIDGAPQRLFQRVDLGVGECIYGLGERFGPFVKNGQSVVIWNEDPGTNSDLAYKNVPFCLSNAGYGLLVNSPGKVEFEIATERVSQVQFSNEGDCLDYYFFYGPGPKQVLEKYTRLAGRPALPPPWSLGLWLSTSFTTRYNEETINEFVDGMAARDLPLSVFHFDCFWMKERHWCDFEWDREAFPNPKAMLHRLKTKGLRICVWINPYISQLSSIFEEGHHNGYLLKRADGSTFQRDAWQPGTALVDFTNPAAVDWYKGKLRALLEGGVDCFKTDFGERIPTDVTYHDGSDPQMMHNYYAYLYNKAVFEVVAEVKGSQEALVFARAATVGGQKFPVHWGGDTAATWEAMAENLRGGLSFSLCGAGFWSHDIGGFAGKANPSLFKRWTAFGLLSSHSRLHGSESYRVPWLYDEEVVDVMRHFTRLKNRLFPYLYGISHEAQQNGWPTMRPMVLEFPSDNNCLYLDRQYMLGPALLVAPVFSEDGKVSYYLPDGTWSNLLDGRRLEGGRWLTDVCDFSTIPLFVRPGSILAMSRDQTSPQWTVHDALDLHVYPTGSDFTAAATLGTSDGAGPLVVTCTRRGGAVEITGDSRLQNVTIHWHDPRPVSAGGADVRFDKEKGVCSVDWNMAHGALQLSEA